MKLRARATALTLLTAILLSSFGIARVTHFCNMAAQAVEMAGCGSGDGHNCCEKPGSENETGDPSCCSTKVQMFRAELQSLYKTPLRVSSEQIALVRLWAPVAEFHLLTESESPLPPDRIPPSSPGRTLTTAHCIFLI